MTWTTSPARLSDFVAQHEWLSTAPEAGFVRVPMAERRDATGVDVIRGIALARVGANAHTTAPITDRSEWFEVLADIFDLPFDTARPEWRDRLWDGSSKHTEHGRHPNTEVRASLITAHGPRSRYQVTGPLHGQVTSDLWR
jgi:hypothetical protein